MEVVDGISLYETDEKHWTALLIYAPAMHGCPRALLACCRAPLKWRELFSVVEALATYSENCTVALGALIQVPPTASDEFFSLRQMRCVVLLFAPDEMPS